MSLLWFLLRSAQSLVVPGVSRLSRRRVVVASSMNVAARPRQYQQQQQQQQQLGVSTRRCLSSIDIYNEQDDLVVDTPALQGTVANIRSILGYDDYAIQVILVNDEVMQERNRETRGMDTPTDILSFSFFTASQPGKLDPPQFDIPEYYNLGDILVNVPYVMRRCQEDYDYYEGNGEYESDSDETGSEESDDDSNVYDDDRGVSGAMAHVYDPEKRIHMLMVHGMLHLVGYDHMEDDDYELMVAREEEILQELGFMEPRNKV